MRLIDTHCHLYHQDYDPDRDDVIARAYAAGVEQLVVIGYDLPSSEAAVALAAGSEHIYATVGVHPHEAEAYSEELQERIGALAHAPRVVAIGEIGFDFYRDLSPRDAQERAFRAQIQLALALRLPIVVHTRESVAETLEVLADYAPAGLRGVMHCWSGTQEQADRALELGFVLGIGGVVTFKNGRSLQEIVARVPLECLVLETDCPYLAPTPHRGRRNEPGYVPLIAQGVAELRGLTMPEVAAATTATAERLFGLSASART